MIAYGPGTGKGKKEELDHYLWERVVQDLIECAQDVCFKDDWGEEARADAAQLFYEVLEGSTSTINDAMHVKGLTRCLRF